MKVPFLSLFDINKNLHPQLNQSFLDFLDSGHYILGQNVKSFENNFASFCDAKYCIGLANGLDALILILESFNFKPQSEVIVPANTYFASILAIIRAGLKPILVEPNEHDMLINTDEIHKAININTVAILAVNLYGRQCDFKTIKKFKEKYKLKVIVDAAQSHGAIHEKSKSCLGADAVAYSFYPTKNLGAFADAGAVICDDENIFKNIQSKRNYGSTEKYVFEHLGLNSRLSELQAGLLDIKLQYLSSDTDYRRSLAKIYFENINNPALILPPADRINEDAWHLYIIRVNDRKKLIKHLTENGVGYDIHYPIPPHKQKALSAFNNLSFPITEKIHETVISLPLNTSLNREHIKYVSEVLNKFEA